MCCCLPHGHWQHPIFALGTPESSLILPCPAGGSFITAPPLPPPITEVLFYLECFLPRLTRVSQWVSLPETHPLYTETQSSPHTPLQKHAGTPCCTRRSKLELLSFVSLCIPVSESSCSLQKLDEQCAGPWMCPMLSLPLHHCSGCSLFLEFPTLCSAASTGPAQLSGVLHQNSNNYALKCCNVNLSMILCPRPAGWAAAPPPSLPLSREASLAFPSPLPPQYSRLTMTSALILLSSLVHRKLLLRTSWEVVSVCLVPQSYRGQLNERINSLGLLGGSLLVMALGPKMA